MLVTASWKQRWADLYVFQASLASQTVSRQLGLTQRDCLKSKQTKKQNKKTQKNSDWASQMECQLTGEEAVTSELHALM